MTVTISDASPIHYLASFCIRVIVHCLEGIISMKRKLIVGLLLAIFCQALALAQSTTVEQVATTKDGRKVILKSDGTWRYVDHPTGEKSATANLSFDTGVVFKSGDVKPIARATF